MVVEEIQFEDIFELVSLVISLIISYILQKNNLWLYPAHFM